MVGCQGLTEGDDVPDIAIDPEEGVLTVINAAAAEKSFYISTECACFDAGLSRLSVGPFRNKDGREGRCCTFILTLAPRMSMEVCRIDGSEVSLCYPSVWWRLYFVFA